MLPVRLSDEAARHKALLGLQISQNAEDIFTELAGSQMPEGVRPGALVSAVAYTALGMNQTEVDEILDYSGAKVRDAAQILGVPTDLRPVQIRPVLVRTAFRAGLLEVARKGRSVNEGWPVPSTPLRPVVGQAMDGISRGMTDQEIASLIGISLWSLKAHRLTIKNEWAVSDFGLAVTVGHHVGFFACGEVSDPKMRIPVPEGPTA